MGLAEIKAQAQAAREAERQAKIVVWQGAIESAIAAALVVTQDAVKEAAAEQGLPENLAWVSLNEHLPAGTLEAWVDNEGVLDIEVPRDIALDLAAFIEAGGIRCGIEIGPWIDRAVLHAAIYQSPPPPPDEEPLPPPDEPANEGEV